VGVDLVVGVALPAFFLFEIAAQLQDHVGVVDDDPALPRGEIPFEIDRKADPAAGIAHHQFGVDLFVAQHHAPGEAVALFGPAGIAGIEQVAQGREDLDGGVDGE